MKFRCQFCGKIFTKYKKTLKEIVPNCPFCGESPEPNPKAKIYSKNGLMGIERL